MKIFKWTCFGLAIHFLLLSTWMLVALPDLTKLYAIAPFLTSPFFFWAFRKMTGRIKQEAAQEAHEAAEKRLEEQCLATYQHHRQKTQGTPRTFN